MKRILLSLFILLLWKVNAAAQNNDLYARIETPQGWCIIKLYTQTPIHRRNFVELVNEGYFNKTTFNRILKHFVIQGGDPDSLYTKPHQLNKSQRWLAPELNDTLFHKRGAVAMGRDDNAEQSSFGTQFYIVDGKPRNNAQLDSMEVKYHHRFSNKQRQVYTTIGGTPSLDQHYTVFGEIVKGIDLIDKITAVKVDKDGNPETTVWMKVTMLKPKKAAQLLKR